MDLFAPMLGLLVIGAGKELNGTYLFTTRARFRRLLTVNTGSFARPVGRSLDLAMIGNYQLSWLANNARNLGPLHVYLKSTISRRAS